MSRPENLEQLEQYYKKVLNCVICKQKYGSDLQKSEDGICPGCHQKLMDGEKKLPKRKNQKIKLTSLKLQ